MTFEDFGELVDQRFDKCLDTLIRKGAGYNDTVKNERLHSFKRAAAIKGTNPVAALDGMWLKHRVSIEDELNKMAADPNYLPSDKWIEDKLGDNINYTLLLEALIAERKKEVLTI